MAGRQATVGFKLLAGTEALNLMRVMLGLAASVSLMLWPLMIKASAWDSTARCDAPNMRNASNPVASSRILLTLDCTLTNADLVGSQRGMNIKPWTVETPCMKVQIFERESQEHYDDGTYARILNRGPSPGGSADWPPVWTDYGPGTKLERGSVERERVHASFRGYYGDGSRDAAFGKYSETWYVNGNLDHYSVDGKFSWNANLTRIRVNSSPRVAVQTAACLISP